MTVRVLLVGAGADIGANLVALSAEKDRTFPITDILTNSIESSGIGRDQRTPLRELASRLVQARPDLLGQIETSETQQTLSVRDRTFRVHFGDFEHDLDRLGRFDIAILATSRTHIRSYEHLSRLENIASVVVGVAENTELPALYPALLSARPEHFAHGRRVTGPLAAGSYALGSCQCAGWTSGLRVVADYCEARGVDLAEVLVHAEVDIVHPDTASSNFGMKRVGARTEDPRDNLRPGISQVAESMARFAPATSSNTVSLRVLTQPPGYQVQRFFLNLSDVRPADLVVVASAYAQREPNQLMVADSPLGSRAYSAGRSSTVLLGTREFLHSHEIGGLTELVMQGFVHNTRGYSAAILDAVERILRGADLTIIDSHLPNSILEA